MNSVHEQFQTVTLNSALSQNWVVCTVSRSWTLLRSQQVGRAHVARSVPQVVRSACAGCAHSTQVMGASRDLPSAQPKPPKSRPQKIGVATPIFIRQPEPCRDIKSVSRHHSGQSRSRPQNEVATLFLLPSPKPGRNTKTRSRPFWRLTYVATSISCRDLVYAQSGISRSRRQNPGREARDLLQPSQVATPLPGRDLTPNQTRSRPQ